MNTMCNKNLTAEPRPVTLVMSKSKHPTVKVGNYLLHSIYNPVKEAKKLAEIHYKKNSLHILFGFGLGYLAKELLARMGENDLLLIIEPEQQVIRLALETNDVSELIQNGKVIFNNGKDISSLTQCLQFYMREGFLGRINLIESPNYTILYPGLAQVIVKLLKECSMLELINVNTFHTFARLWQENYISNLYQAMRAKPFKSLVNRLSCPVIIAAAGPSLTKQLPLLRTVHNKAFILCSGSAINSLLLGGVEPHAVVTVDGGEANYNHFKGLDIDSIPLFYSLFVHKEIPRNHNGIQIVFNEAESSFSQLTNLVLKKDIGSVKGGQSVSNFCLDIACQLTSGPVCFVGQDLAYTDNKTHAAGNKGEVKLDPEQINNKPKYTNAKGYYGGSVLTDYVFLGMKKTIENYISNLRNHNDNRPVINATEGGVMIEHVQNMPLNSFINLYCCNDYTNMIQNLYHEDDSHLPDWNHLYQIMREEKKKAVGVIKLCKKAQKEIAKVNTGKIKSDTVFFKTMKVLDEIDKRLMVMLENNFMHYILEPVIFRVQHRYLETENETPEEHAKRVLTKSENLYKEISEAAGHSKKYLSNLLEKIKPHLNMS